MSVPESELTGRDNQPLTPYELERLIERSPPAIRRDIGRLVAEVRALRDATAEREFFESQEIET